MHRLYHVLDKQNANHKRQRKQPEFEGAKNAQTETVFLFFKNSRKWAPISKVRYKYCPKYDY